MRADVRELVHGGVASDDGPVVDVSLAGYSHVAYEYAVVAHAAVMRHMHVGHDERVVAYSGHSLAAGLGAAVDGGALPYGHVVAYLHIGLLAVELQVLGDSAHDGSGEDLAVVAHGDVGENVGMGIDLAVVPDGHVVVDEGVGSDLDVLSQFCVRAHCRERMNFNHKN